MELFEDLFSELFRFAASELGFSRRASSTFAATTMMALVAIPIGMLIHFVRSSGKSRRSAGYQGTDQLQAKISALQKRVDELERKVRTITDEPKS